MGRSSRQLYRCLGIDSAPAFSPEVQAALREEGNAEAFLYAGGAVIHVIGPNFREHDSPTWDSAVRRLGRAYL
jgi:hypothetical protein